MITKFICFSFFYYLLFVVFEEWRTYRCNHQFQGEVREHSQRMFTRISRYHYSYTVEGEVCLHTHFGYIWCHYLLLEEP